MPSDLRAGMIGATVAAGLTWAWIAFVRRPIVEVVTIRFDWAHAPEGLADAE